MRWLPFLAVLLVGANRGLPPDSIESRRLEYVHQLSDFNGAFSVSWPDISADPETGEVYVVYAGEVRIFTVTGMEAYRFADAGQGVNGFQSLVPLGGGEVLVSASRHVVKGLFRLDYRGQFMEEFRVSGLPAGAEQPIGWSMLRSGDSLYFFERERWLLLRTTLAGEFKELRDIGSRLNFEGGSLNDAEPRGIAVDKSGRLFVAVPTLFRVIVVEPDGTTRSFGQMGSNPGKFNVVSGVAVDEEGWVYVADILRCIVNVFDPELKWQGQVGGRFAESGALITPGQIIFSSGMLYVTQGRSQGVAVFRRRGAAE